MGWTQQGYNAQGFNPSMGIKSDYWFVDCNGDTDDTVESYCELSPDMEGWNDKIKIVYGTSSREYFRGYILTDNKELAKSLLSKLNTFLVYKGKYGGVKEFNARQLTLLPYLGIILFFETDAKKYLGSPISLVELVKELLDEIEFGIRHRFINNYEKSLEEIAEELKEKIAMTKNECH